MSYMNDDLTDAEKRNLIPCWKCGGTGKNSTGSRRCSACKGSGKVISQLGLISEAILGFKKG